MEKTEPASILFNPQTSISFIGLGMRPQEDEAGKNLYSGKEKKLVCNKNTKNSFQNRHFPFQFEFTTTFRRAIDHQLESIY